VSLLVRTTPEADAQILASPNLFAEELAASFDVIGHAPHIGRL